MERPWTLLLGDSREALRGFADSWVDSIVTDPPYELGFMGRAWDASGVAYDVDLWREALRVLKPGGHLLAFGGTRTYHRMACAIEDAGFEVRDSLHWIYGSGFPKSLDVSKAIDKAVGAERESVGARVYGDGHIRKSTRSIGYGKRDPAVDTHIVTAPATDAARQWSGWGTALKPAHEPVVVARKPLDGTVAANVLAHGTGAINVDGCRVAHGEDVDLSMMQRQQAEGTGISIGKGFVGSNIGKEIPMYKPGGRWPPNILLSHMPDCGDECAEGCAVAEMDGQSGTLKSGNRKAGEYETQGYMGAKANPMPAIVGDTGGASRFFPVFRYQAKASRADRDAGLDAFDAVRTGAMRATENGSMLTGSGNERTTVRANTHPTVKPIELMRWLVRLVTPPGGVVLDPFTGSGTTGIAARREGATFVGIEREPEYHRIALARIAAR